MKKEFRIKKNQEIDQIIKLKKSKGNQFFVVYKEKGTINHFRYAISIGKKYGKAVERNLAKRRVRAILASLVDKIKVYDFIIIVRPKVKELTFLELLEQLTHVLMISNLIKKEKEEKDA